MTKIKVCGLYTPKDIAMVNDAQPDYIGFIINFPKSHRSISPQYAKELKKQLNPSIEAVGVFVNESIQIIKEMCDDNIIDIIQLHGSEDEVFIKKLRESTTKKIIKAFVIASKDDVTEAIHSSADYILLDGGMGEGKTFPYHLIQDLKRAFFLAGGLTAKSIPTAIAQTQAFAVDISSGVETNKAKDKNKIDSAVQSARIGVEK